MMPGIATAFTIAGLSSLGLPATAGFVAEFLTFLGAWASAHPWWLLPGVIGAFLTAIYVLRVGEADLLGAEERGPALPASARRAGHRVGGARHPRVRHRALRRRAGPGASTRSTRPRCPLLQRLAGAAMTAWTCRWPCSIRRTPLVPRGRRVRAGCRRAAAGGWSGAAGRIGRVGWLDRSPASSRCSGVGVRRASRAARWLRGAFVLDALALFAKRLFLGVGRPQRARRRWRSTRGPSPDARSPSTTSRCSASLLGMLVLASARELILLFVAFELMSIPLYFLTGFRKRDDTAAEGGAEVLPGRHRVVGRHRCTACRSSTA